MCIRDRFTSWPYPTSFATPEDATGKLGKAIGFYYNNCGFCHKPGRPGGGSGLLLNLPVVNALPSLDGGLGDGGGGLPFDQTPIYKTGVNVAHVNTVGGMFPAGTFKRITKGDADKSVLPGRDSIRDPDGGIGVGQMPPVLSRAVDQTSVDATRAWINALTP